MTAADWIDNLARLAEAASPGPWSADGYGSGQQVTGATGTIFADTLASHEDAEFIAAANPTTILRLIGEVHRWKAAWEMASPLLTERDALAARLAAVEAELQRQRHRTAEFQTIAAGFANRAVAAEDRLAAVEALSWELSPADGPRLRAALAAPTDTTKEN